MRHPPHRLLTLCLLLASVLASMGLSHAQDGRAGLDTPVDIFLVWIGDQEPEPIAEPVASLDLDTLETRLRKTKAIGLFTKLELKSQVGELVSKFEDFHNNKSDLNLDQLEEHFDLLVMKLLLLLQDDDPELHHEIAYARPALWATLSSPEQFAEVNGP